MVATKNKKTAADDDGSGGEKKLTRKQKRAIKEAELEEKRVKEQELLELQARVSELLAYKREPTPLEYVTAHIDDIVANPWQLITDQQLTSTFLEHLYTVFSTPTTQPDDTKRIATGLHALSAFVVGQPVFFITDVAILKCFVRLLELLLNDEDLFSCLLLVALPTVRNLDLTQVVLESRLVDVVLKFVDVHMPPVVDESTDRRHAYNDTTFSAVMTMIESLSRSPAVRRYIKERETSYLHLRGLASGSVGGLRPARRTAAQVHMQYFSADSFDEKTVPPSGELPARINAHYMLRYWRGHIHRLYCNGIGVENAHAAVGGSGGGNGGGSSGSSGGDGNGGGGNGGSNGGGQRGLFKGFADQSALDTLNNDIKKRSHKQRRAL